MITVDTLNELDSLIVKYSALEISKSILKRDISQSISNEEIRKMISIAIQLTSSNKSNNRNRILKVATLVPRVSEDETFLLAGRILLGKLKNYPMVKVLENQVDGISEKIGIIDNIRELYEKESNTIECPGQTKL